MNLQNKFLGAIFLIAGTAVGAGMLALPVSTGIFGFIPASAMLLLCWFFMTFSALLMLEVNLCLPPDTNLISMAKLTLGRSGEILAWVTYLLLLYALLAAYLTGLSSLLIDVEKSVFGINYSLTSSAILLAFLSALLIYFGIQTVDLLNRLLMAGLIITFFTMIIGLFPHIEINALRFHQTKSIWNTLPLLLTTFGFQIIIPTIRTYLKSNVTYLRRAILIGSLIPLAIYLIWEILILGVIPVDGTQGLQEILNSGHPEIGLSHTLMERLELHWIGIGFRFFAAFAIATSFIGVALSLFDFLSDGLNIQKQRLSGRISVLLLTFLPPLFFAVAYPAGFITALEYAGIFVAVLLILLPAAMAWRERYNCKIERERPYQVKGGKMFLATSIIFAVFVIAIQLAK